MFHASLLTKYNDKGGYRPLPPILMEDGSLEYEVERILDSRVIKRGKKSVTQYYIKWLGYDHSYDSWEPEATYIVLTYCDSSYVNSPTKGQHHLLPLNNPPHAQSVSVYVTEDSHKTRGGGM